MTGQAPPGGRALDRVLAPVPAPALFVASGISQYTGAALAVGLYALLLPHSVAWLRAAVSAIVLLTLLRPWRLRWSRDQLRSAIVLGVALVAMNMLFYVAIRYLPLGAAVSIEFAGPALVAAWGSRTTRSRVAVVLAVLGVILISLLGLSWSGTDPAGLAIGLACAVGAGATWALYVVVVGRIALTGDGQASLAVGTTVASLLFAPLAVPFLGALTSADLTLFLAIVGVGVLSSVVPYLLDQVAVKRLGTSAFALLNALLPATATVVGLVLLRQQPSLAEIAGLLAISVAVALAPRAARPRPTPGALGPGQRG